MTDDAVLDGQRLADVEFNPGRANAGALDGQATKIDFVVRSGIDINGVGTGNRHDAGLDTRRASDSDRVSDIQRSKARAVDCGDLAADGYVIKGVLEGLARRPECTRITVVAIRRNEDACA